MAVRKLVLTYFDIKGKAEPVRLALAVGGVPFEDRRLQRGEWAELKPQTRWRYLPELTVTEDGKAPVTFGQSNAQLRYVGRLAGLYPADEPLQAALVDEMLDALEDVRTPVADSVREENPERKAEKRQKLAAETLPVHLRLLRRRGRLAEGGEAGAQLGLRQRRAIWFQYFVERVRDLGPAIAGDLYGSVDRALHEF